MSNWTADVGMIKVKAEYETDFGFFFQGRYENITQPVFLSFLENHGEYMTFHHERICDWSHDNEKKSWIGQYKTAYENGVFTYGLSYNQNNIGRATFISEFFLDLLPEITQQCIFRDFWFES